MSNHLTSHPRRSSSFRLDVLLALLLSACDSIGIGAGSIVQQPRQTEAVALVWHDVYGQDRRPPAVRWVEGADLNCRRAEWPIDQRGFLLAGSVCVAGFTWSWGEVSVAIQPGDHFYQIGLAHEFLHAAKFGHGSPDAFHEGDEWLPLESCPSPAGSCGLVETARLALTSLDL